VRVSDLANREAVRNIAKHMAGVWSVAFSPDGQLLASASVDGTAKLLDTGTWKEIATLKPPHLADNDHAALDKNEVARKIKPPAARKALDGPPLIELFEDDTTSLIDNLNNNGGNDASVAARQERAPYSGTAALSVTPFQRYNRAMPNWRFRIVENPGPGEYRYLRFAWKRTDGPGIMLQLFALSGGWQHRYYAGALSDEVKGWGAMIRVADEAPRQWEVVTRDLFQDFGAKTITGIGLTALDGGGEAHFDHIYLGRTIEDLDRAAAAVSKPAVVEEERTPPRRLLWLAMLAVGVIVFLVAGVMVWRGKKARSSKPQRSGL
jgi:hypothetical protein